MTIRNFTQTGQAYGSIPASITTTINGTVIFSGPVTTVDLPLPSQPDRPAVLPTICTWTNTVDFAGTQSFSITVTGSPLILGYTLADHCWANNVAEFFNLFYTQNDGGVQVTDPLTNVAIDGVAMQRGPDNSELSGQWQWLIPAGSTLTATLNVNAGVEPA